MWIAKNSITGKTYGKSFDSIFDCQMFIDKELMFLEYEMRRAFAVEAEVERHLRYSDKGFPQCIVDEMCEVISNVTVDIGESLKPHIDYSLGAIKQEEYDSALTNVANARWQKNNVIRCWYVEQERFATGFDF